MAEKFGVKNQHQSVTEGLSNKFMAANNGYKIRNKCLLYVGPNGILQSLSNLQQSRPRFSCLGPF